MKNAYPRLLAATAGCLALGLVAAQAAPASRTDDGRFSVGQAPVTGQSRNGGQENPATAPNQMRGTMPSTTGSGDQVGRSARSGGQENPATSPNQYQGIPATTGSTTKSGDLNGRASRNGGQENPAHKKMN